MVLERVVDVSKAAPFKPTPKRNGASFANDSPVIESEISHSAAGSSTVSRSIIIGGRGETSSSGLVLFFPRPHHSPFSLPQSPSYVFLTILLVRLQHLIPNFSDQQLLPEGLASIKERTKRIIKRLINNFL